MLLYLRIRNWKSRDIQPQSKEEAFIGYFCLIPNCFRKKISKLPKYSWCLDKVPSMEVRKCFASPRNMAICHNADIINMTKLCEIANYTHTHKQTEIQVGNFILQLLLNNFIPKYWCLTNTVACTFKRYR